MAAATSQLLALALMPQVEPLPNLDDPEQSFRAPIQIVMAACLTRGQKLLALDRWADRVKHRLALTVEIGSVNILADPSIFREIACARKLVEAQFGAVGKDDPHRETN
jgi:hypothetical protein